MHWEYIDNSSTDFLFICKPKGRDADPFVGPSDQTVAGEYVVQP